MTSVFNENCYESSALMSAKMNNEALKASLMNMTMENNEYSQKGLNEAENYLIVPTATMATSSAEMKRFAELGSKIRRPNSSVIMRQSY